MPDIVRFTVCGTPAGQARPRATTGPGDRPMLYKIKGDREREQGIRLEYLSAAGGMVPWPGPVRLMVHARFIKPQSWSKKKKDSTDAKSSKPDLDNIVKLVKDALNKAAWLDDAQVVEIAASKYFGPAEGLIVEVHRLII